MIIEPTLRHLAVARDTLLAPFGLTDSELASAFSELFEHRIDFADLYFQQTRSESWRLEEGIVKSGSFGIDQGVGVRAVVGDRTAFAYSDAIGSEALRHAARTVRSIARRGSGRVKVAAGAPLEPRAGHAL